MLFVWEKDLFVVEKVCLNECWYISLDVVGIGFFFDFGCYENCCCCCFYGS